MMRSTSRLRRHLRDLDQAHIRAGTLNAGRGVRVTLETGDIHFVTHPLSRTMKQTRMVALSTSPLQAN